MEHRITAEKVRFVMDVNRADLKVYNKAPYIIPILKVNGVYKTGQDLTTNQMMSIRISKDRFKEQEALTPEQKIKYPFVINPSGHYKVKHLDWLRRNDDYQKAMIDLLLLSGKCAENKTMFDSNPQRFVGYLEDAVGEAIAKNNIKDDQFEAAEILRQSSNEDYKRIALVFSFNTPNVFINTKAPHDVLRGQLLELCDSHPKEIKACFSKYNPGIEKDIFVLECVDAKIIIRKDKGDLYYENDYIGKTIDDVKKYLAGRDKQHLYAKFQSLLDQKQGHTIFTGNDYQGKKDNISLIMECKAAIFDGNFDDAQKAFIKVDKSENPVEYESLKVKLDEMKAAREGSKEDVLARKFRDEMMNTPIEEIWKKISNKLSNYSKDDCAAIWNDREKLVEYMVKVKFKK
jgi:hypothetical protein